MAQRSEPALGDARARAWKSGEECGFAAVAMVFAGLPTLTPGPVSSTHQRKTVP